MTHTRRLIWGFAPRALAWGFLVAMAAAGAGGCTIITKELGDLPPQGRTFRDGQTHYRDVLAVAGPPTKLSALGDGLVFLYEHVTIAEHQLGISVRQPWLNLLKFAVGQSKADRQILVLVFDDRGLLLSHRWRDWKDDLGRGGAVQPIIAVIPVVDSGNLDEEPDAHDWGVALLEAKLAEALNRANNLETGQQGVEQGGTPYGVGQHTLEMRSEFRDRK